MENEMKEIQQALEFEGGAIDCREKTLVVY